jgi:hypothetical protein
MRAQRFFDLRFARACFEVDLGLKLHDKLENPCRERNEDFAIVEERLEVLRSADSVKMVEDLDDELVAEKAGFGAPERNRWTGRAGL